MRRPLRYTLIPAALLLAALPALAQPFSRPGGSGTQMNLSASLGPSINWLSDVTVVDAGSEQAEGENSYPVSVGFKGGLMLGVRRGPLGGRAGVSFLNTGSVFDGTTFLNEDELSVNFVTFALDAQYVRPVGPADLYAFAGPEFRYLLDLSGAENLGDFRDGFSSLGASASFGAGVRLHVLGYSFGPEVRYALDLSGLSGETLEAPDGTPVELESGYSLDNLIFGLVFGR